MATPNFWSNVSVSVQSAIATAITITGITKANPAVVSYSGVTDPANGDIITLSIQGMNQLNDVVARVANVNAAGNTLELEGIDSTLFNTFTSGSFQVVTLGTTISHLVDINASGGEPEFADTTTIHQQVRTRTPTVTSPLSYSMTGLWDPQDAGFRALQAASRALAKRVWKFTFPSGSLILFNGYVSATGVPTGSAQQVVNTPITLEAQNLPTPYAS